MLTLRAAQRGFSIVELMVTILVLGLIIGMAGPSFFEWLQNQQVRAAAEALTNGLQVARGSAIQRNLAVQISVGPGTGWTVSEALSGTVIQTREHQEGTANATFVTTPGGSSTVTFSPLGGMVANTDGTPSMARVDVDNALTAGASARALRVVITGGGSIRMCDPTPAIVAPDPRACP